MSADIKIFTDDIEGQALDQCRTIAKSPVFETARIRIMPDVHAGKGCVIGFTATGMEKLIPNLVGVDIGCGMLTARLDTDDLDLAKLDRLIAQSVPAGFDVHDHEVAEAQRYLDELVCRDRIRNKSRLLASLGTLGGGNHFIEVDTDEDGRLYLVIHTGSRNLGVQVAEIYQDLAIKHCPPTTVLRQMGFDDPDGMARYFQDIKDCTRFRTWYFGHLHEDCALPWERTVALYRNIVQIA